MKKSAAYVVLLLVVVIAVSIVSIRIFTSDSTSEPETPVQEKVIATLPPEQSQTAEESAAITETPEATEEPSEETPPEEETPSETEAPIETRPPIETEPPATPQPIAADGSFRSDTGTYLNLVAEWAADNNGGDMVTLQVVLSAESYSFYTSPLADSLQLTVNGAVYKTGSPSINYDGAELAKTQLAVFTVEVPRGTTTVEAVWHFKGSYSGTELSDITASATLELS